MSANTATPQTINLLVIFASPHKDGYTAQLLDAFLSALPDNVNVNFISAFNSRIVPCIDCGACKHTVGCIYDDVKSFDCAYRSADIAVFATPVYNLSVPAPLKNILDRSQQYFNARFYHNIKPVMEKHKKAVLLITSGSDSDEGANIIEKTLGQMFTVMNTDIAAKIHWKSTDRNPEKHKTSSLNDAASAAKALFE